MTRNVLDGLWTGSAILLTVWILALATTADAHESWISKGQARNAAGEWCCGDGDCFEVPRDRVELHADGYHVKQHITTTTWGIGSHRPTEMDISEVIPFSEAQPSPDGAFWRCQRADGSRRCFFAPPPGS